MIVNNHNETKHVKFISYTGKYPNLCSGILTLEIDGKEYKFGNSIYKEPQGEFPKFWSSGGSVTADRNWNFNVGSGEWVIDAYRLPEQFRKYVAEIDLEFNENVEWGCCGGCI